MATERTYGNMLLEHRPKPKTKKKEKGFSPWTKIGVNKESSKWK